MPQNDFVVFKPSTGEYLINVNLGDASQSTFGPLEEAIGFETLGEAETMAASIGGGTVGTTRPK